MKELSKASPCETGETVVTKGYHLPCKHVLHTAPPAFRAEGNELPLLERCYRSSLEAAVAEGMRVVAFPALGTGAKFNQPPVEAAHVALRTVRRWMEAGDNQERVERIVFVVKNARLEEIYEQLMRCYFPFEPFHRLPASSSSSQPAPDLEAMLLDLPSPPK